MLLLAAPIKQQEGYSALILLHRGLLLRHIVKVLKVPCITHLKASGYLPFLPADA